MLGKQRGSPERGEGNSGEIPGKNRNLGMAGSQNGCPGSVVRESSGKNENLGILGDQRDGKGFVECKFPRNYPELSRIPPNPTRIHPNPCLPFPLNLDFSLTFSPQISQFSPVFHQNPPKASRIPSNSSLTEWFSLFFPSYPNVPATTTRSIGKSPTRARGSWPWATKNWEL